MTTDKLRLGLPSKGRLQEQMIEFFAEAGIKIVKARNERQYAGSLQGVPGVELVFLQAGEIPRELARGEIHLGVTGEDLIRERISDWARKVALLKPLGFGHADLIVAVPKCWVDVATMADLDDVAAAFRADHGHPLRVATKYLNSARLFFQEKGVADYRLVESQGATEGAPATETAEVIVDITSSGETLRANHLKVLEDGLILRSQAQLCASLVAAWGPGARAALGLFLRQIEARERAREAAVVRALIDRRSLETVEAALAAAGAVLGQRPAATSIGLAAIRCPRAAVAEVVALLSDCGARGIEVTRPDMVFEAESETHRAFIARLG